MAEINERQRRFAEAWLATGDAACAARAGGYSRRYAPKLLRRDAVRRYLQARQARDAPGGGRVATEQEILEFLTGVMRGEGGSEGRSGASPRMKAAELLGKRLGIFSEGAEAATPPVIIDDIPASGGRGDGE